MGEILNYGDAVYAIDEGDGWLRCKIALKGIENAEQQLNVTGSASNASQPGTGYPASPKQAKSSTSSAIKAMKASAVPIPKTRVNGCESWSVLLEKENAGQKFGLSFQLDTENQALVVREVTVDGLMLAWNLRHADAAVLPGDCIASVNDKTQIDEMRQELRGSGLQLAVCRYPSYPASSSQGPYLGPAGKPPAIEDRVSALLRERSQSPRNVRPRQKPRPKASLEPIPKTKVNGCEDWCVLLKKENASERYGMSFQLDTESQVLVVREVAVDGLTFDWNLEHPDAEVNPGDRIASINDKTQLDEMKQEILGSELRMMVRRYPVKFEVELTKTAEQSRLGMKFMRQSFDGDSPASSSKPGKLLKITEVSTGGLLDEWNKTHISKGLPQFVVAPGMYIEAANACEFNSDAVSEELRSCTTSARIRIRRHRH